MIATGTPDSAASNEVVVIIGNPAADAYVRSGTTPPPTSARPPSWT